MFVKIEATKTLKPVVERIPADLHTPLSVYLKLAADEEHSFLLESVEGGATLARYSFIGAGPEFVARGRRSSVTLDRGGRGETLPIGLVDFLREELGKFNVEPEAGLPSFTGGAIGYLGFPSAEWFEHSLARPKGLDREFGMMMFFRSVVAFDHARQQILIITNAEAGDEGSLAAANDTNARIREQIESSELRVPRSEPLREGETSVTSNFTREGFIDAVGRAKEYIAAGDCYQVVISQRFSRPTTAGPVSLYRAIRSLNPSPYMFLIKTPERSVVGASPEMLVRVRDSQIHYRPIAGTRPRGSDEAEDRRLADEMAADPKEVAEHQMLVDLGRNDVGRVSEYSSVRVERLMAVEKYSHVQHLVSDVAGRLRPGLDRFDALASCFPAGTVSGAPKVRAIEIIRELEPDERSIYSGAVGHFDHAGNMDTCIAIRTIVLENGVAEVQAGAGIVADSNPEAEYEETVNKAAALLKAIEIAEREL